MENNEKIYGGRMMYKEGTCVICELYGAEREGECPITEQRYDPESYCFLRNTKEFKEAIEKIKRINTLDN